MLWKIPLFSLSKCREQELIIPNMVRLCLSLLMMIASYLQEHEESLQQVNNFILVTREISERQCGLVRRAWVNHVLLLSDKTEDTCQDFSVQLAYSSCPSYCTSIDTRRSPQQDIDPSETIPLQQLTMQVENYPHAEEHDALLPSPDRRRTQRNPPRAFLPTFTPWKANPLWSALFHALNIIYSDFLIGLFQSSWLHLSLCVTFCALNSTQF